MYAALHIEKKGNNALTQLETQTCDLLEMMYSGFTHLCQDFLQKHGESRHYIVPVCINGSSIESLSSQFKYNANGNLSAVNYESALAGLQTTNQVSSENKNTQDEYRNTKINVHGQLRKLQ